MHTKTPLEPAGMPESMPRNKDLQTLINAFRPHRGESIYIPIHMETLWCTQNYITAILILIQQNNLFTHFLSYNSKIVSSFLQALPY